ncbi:MAG TPA: hypothetical protein VHD36_06325 [Pirellulales bacterium]|nr:hypothetical protein [Pirellulales bacterium]
MTADQFRRLTLTLPETCAGAHQGHEDLRVAGKIFATLGYPDAHWGMVKLTPKQQTYFVALNADVFVPVKGAWGRKGSTNVLLKKATKATLLPALVAAWANRAPKKLLEALDA